MKHKMRNCRLALLLPAALAALLFFSSPARADFIFSLQPVITASPGSTGNVFDVLLTNTGAAVTVESFSFGITTADTHISFTGATTATTVDTYIFAGDSFDDTNSFPLFINTLPGQTVEASDTSNSGTGTSVGTGVTFGVGHILFDVANNASPGPVIVTLEDAPTTSLSDTGGASLAFSTLPGTITVTGTTVVPEPAPAGLIICALLGFLILIQRRRSRIN